MGLNFLAVQIYPDAAFNSLAPERWEQLQSLDVHRSTAAMNIRWEMCLKWSQLRQGFTFWCVLALRLKSRGKE